MKISYICCGIAFTLGVGLFYYCNSCGSKLCLELNPNGEAFVRKTTNSYNPTNIYTDSSIYTASTSAIPNGNYYRLYE